MSNEIVSLQSSSSSSVWKHDVFLSFRGEDTRNNFTSHLYHALNQRVTVYKDDKDLEKGKHIASELLQAIEESQISIVVLSRNYASSTWCLDELVKIVQCRNSKGQNVFPIFYDVDPSMVRKQTGAFREAFVKHEENFPENKEKVQNWRNALTDVANLSGWHAKDRNESELIEDIIKEITSTLKPAKLMIFKDLVGMDSRFQELRLLIGTGNDIRIIGIWGMGGIGKTTIARVVYDSISYQFERSSFLANVRETSEKEGLVSLQRQLLVDILKGRDNNIYNMYDGMGKIITSLRYKKVLVVVDDVTSIEQLNALIGKRDWFGPGSRIIITTRDEHLLIIENGVDKVYKAKELNNVEALKLFSLKAFKNFQPPNDFVGLSKQVVRYAEGLPLALEIFGSFLFRRTIAEWKDALKRLHRDSTKEILDRLEISFDGLEETEKDIFLDVACFFKGENKDYVTKVLDGCGFSSTIGINVLVEKSLMIILDYNKLWMHDLLQKMGQNIVKRESPKEPGKRSRLWEEADICHVLTNNTGTEVVEGIILDSPKEELYCSANAFSKMINLRLLKISNVQLSEGCLDFLSPKLRLLDWNGYPLESLPSNLQLNKIVELKLDCSRIKQPWKGIKPLNMLTSISFKDCQYLNKTSDFTCAPNLETVILQGCKRLFEIHPSLLLHDNINFLDMRSCASLTTLPNEIRMKNLKQLKLSFCSKLKNFPEIVGSMDHLWDLDLSETAIKELPSSVGFLSRLFWLNLANCRNLVSVPNTINCLNSLSSLNLHGCSKLHDLLGNLGQIESLMMLEASGTQTRQPMSSIFLLKTFYESNIYECSLIPPSNPSVLHSLISSMRRSSDSMAFRLLSLSSLCICLKSLDLSDCNLREDAIPSDFFDNFLLLSKLSLSKNNFVSVPGSISHLSKLQYLYLDNCKRLQSLPELPSSIKCVHANGCPSLETLSNASSLFSAELSHIKCVNCFKLIGCNSIAFSMLKEHLNKAVPDLRDVYEIFMMQHREYTSKFSIVVPGSEIPEWFRHQSKGCSIRIERPPYFGNGKLLGFVVCCVFCVLEHPPVRWKGYYQLECGTKRFRLCDIALDHSYCEEKLGQALLDHLWLLYFPRHYIRDESQNRRTPYVMKGPNHIEISFRGRGERPGPIYTKSEKWIGLKFKACGIHPIYEVDVEEYNKIDNQSRFWNVNESHRDLVGSTRQSFADFKGNVNFDYAEPQTEGLNQTLSIQGLWA